MAAAKGKRSAKKTSARKAPVKARGNTRRTGRRGGQVISGAAWGLVVLATGVFMLFSLWTPSNAGALVALRGLLSGALGRLHWIYVLLLCWLGLQMAFSGRWPLRKGLLFWAVLLALCFSTLLQVFRMGDLLRSLRADGYIQNYNGFLWKSYEASKNVPLGGGVIGALLGYPMGKYLDILGSALVLFFVIGGVALIMIRSLAPGTGGRVMDWLDQLRYDWAARREERSTERAALEAERDAALLVPVPEELLDEEEEEAPPPKAVTARGKKKSVPPPPKPASPQRPSPAPARKLGPVDRRGPTAAPKPSVQALEAPPARRDIPPWELEPPAPPPEPRRKLYIEDILPETYTP
ncbi:MAG: hypothetical protein FWF69_00510, partial [Firmicutes bacterium]|nr:hypothetical protein [Bacillota bacterium]